MTGGLKVGIGAGSGNATGSALRRLALATTALMTLATASVYAAPTPESLEYVKEAQDKIKDGDIPAAIIELKNAVRVDPDNSEARVILAEQYLRTGDPSAAQRELETARSRGFDENRIATPLTQAYYLQGRFADVLKNFDPSKFQGDTRRTILVAQARAHIALQNPKEARALVDIALSESPDFSAALAADAILLRFDGNPKKAEEQIDKALAKDPIQVELLVLKGELRQQQQDLDGAVSYFDKAVEQNARYTRARVARAMANLARNKLDLIEADVSETLAIEPQNPLGLYLRSFQLSRDGKFKDATQILLTLPGLLEGYPPAKYLLAASAFADNQFEVALTYAEQYVAKVPEDIGGAKLLAAIYQRMANPAKAVAVLEPVAPKNPEDNQLKLQLATALLGVGRSEEAIKLFQQGVEADPENAEAKLALAVSQIRAGATEAGLSALQGVIASKPSSVEANSILILTHLQNRNIDKALEAAKAMIAADANNPNAHNLLGTVHMAAQDFVAAKNDFQTALAKDPKFVAAPLNLARVEERSNNPAEAKKWYQKAIEIDAKNLTAYDGLANLAMAENKPDDALAALEKSIRANPQAPQPRLRTIGILLNRQMNDRALIVARDFANTLPDDPQAIDALGRAQLAVKDMTNAIGSFEQLAAKFPKNPEPQRRLARVYIAAERKADAVKAMNRAIELAPEYQAAIVDRITYERNEAGLDAALALAKTYADERSDSITRLVVLSDLQAVANKNDAALAGYRRAWDRSPSPALLQRIYGAYVRLNRSEEGLALLKDWVGKNPNDYDSRFLITNHYINSQKYEEAIRETESMNGVLPENPILLNNLAWLYGEKGDPKAIEIGEKAFRLAPDSAEVADTLGWLHYQKGTKPRALELLKKAHELQPQRPEIGYHYAVALKDAGDNNRAKEVLQKSLTNKAPFSERKPAEELLKQLGG